ncbi:hypothetical protein AAJCM20276_29140 [Acetobacter aceti]|uniref:Uncharacterized protein n=1 Tax=Acetobacter aceti TaxID=435 RepID=A0A6S6PML5_ACEAC|nr:hypothetical protein AAJCM20276_29140 [Acetobacter aceti]
MTKKGKLSYTAMKNVIQRTTCNFVTHDIPYFRVTQKSGIMCHTKFDFYLYYANIKMWIARNSVVSA